MATAATTTLHELVGPSHGILAHSRVNTLRLRRQVAFDIADGSHDTRHAHVRSFFETVPWIELIPSVTCLGEALDYLDGSQATKLGAVHVLLGGDQDQLHFRLNPGEQVRVYEMPLDLTARGGRIEHHEMLPHYRRPVPEGLSDETPLILHGCTTGAHDGLLVTVWYAFGCRSPLYMPMAPLTYSLTGHGQCVRVEAPGHDGGVRCFRKLDLSLLGQRSF